MNTLTINAPSAHMFPCIRPAVSPAAATEAVFHYLISPAGIGVANAALASSPGEGEIRRRRMIRELSERSASGALPFGEDVLGAVDWRDIADRLTGWR